MNEKKSKKIPEKGIKWGLSAIFAIIIWGMFFFGINVLGDAGMTFAFVAWLVFIFFGWKHTGSMKLGAIGAFSGAGGNTWGERFQNGVLATLLLFVIKFILSMIVGVVVTPYVIGKMLAPKVTAWLRRREELKNV